MCQTSQRWVCLQTNSNHFCKAKFSLTAIFIMSRNINELLINGVLSCCHETFAWFDPKKTNLWWDNSWYLHHDNLVLFDFLAKNAINMIPQPPYSPDLSPADFFPKLKLPLRSHRFDSIEEIQKNSLNELKVIPESVF